MSGFLSGPEGRQAGNVAGVPKRRSLAGQALSDWFSFGMNAMQGGGGGGLGGAAPSSGPPSGGVGAPGGGLDDLFQSLDPQNPPPSTVGAPGPAQGGVDEFLTAEGSARPTTPASAPAVSEPSPAAAKLTGISLPELKGMRTAGGIQDASTPPTPGGPVGPQRPPPGVSAPAAPPELRQAAFAALMDPEAFLKFDPGALTGAVSAPRSRGIFV